MERKKYNKAGDDFYSFTPERAFREIEKHWKEWDRHVKPGCYVVGISGGVDSSCVAALAVRIFGKNRVVGVSLPCDGQKDMEDVNKVFASLGGLRRLTIDIGDMYHEGLQSIENQALEITDACRTNMPARIRMTMLYGIAQSLNGVVLNTCNRSEDVVGYSTLYGDNAGSYAPIVALTKTEVKAITEWLGIPKELVYKTPIDGLQPLTDEENLGMTYAKIDDFIRGTGPTTREEDEKIQSMFLKNRFKLDIIHIPGPKFEYYPDSIRANYGV